MAYDSGTQTLTVTFHNSATYEYPHVTPGEYSALKNAESHGNHFARHFRNRNFKRVS